MGKSVEILALILANPRPDKSSPGTLVLCPPTLLPNWETECTKLLPPSVAVLMLTSARKSKTKAADLAKCADLVGPHPCTRSLQ